MEHVSKVRIYYYDSDSSGIVYHSNYMKYLDVSRTDMMFAAGVDPFEVCSNGNYLVINEMNLKYMGSARPGDTVDVTTSVLRLRRSAITLRQRVLKDDEQLLEVMLTMVYLDENGRPTRLPPGFALLPFESRPAEEVATLKA